MSGVRLVLGVDGGGTKTDVVLADLHGAVLAACQTSGTNHENVGAERVVATISDAVNGLLGDVGAGRGDVAMAAYGLAGIDWPSDEEMMRAALAGVGLSGGMLVVNDSEVALRAGCTRAWGMVSSVGTGTVTAGVNRDGRRFRTMAVGWGEPSGSWSMVALALEAVAAAHHGTGPATALTGIMLEAFGHHTVPELFEALTRGRAVVGAGHAPLLDLAVDAGDAVALDVLRGLAGRHADMVGGVARHLGMADEEFELVMSGGVHVANGPFGEHFRLRVAQHCPSAQPVLLTVPPVRGAVQLAIDALAGEVVGR
ncbi:MAG: N-acetylglucosamine kinase [Actinomycetota bacterium]